MSLWVSLTVSFTYSGQRQDSANDTLNLQVDNGTTYSLSYTGGSYDSAYPLTVGAFADVVQVFNGRVDEVALYKRMLTAAERTWLYNNGKGRNYADLMRAVQHHAVLGAATQPYTCPQGETCVHDQGQSGVNNTYGYDANGNQTTRTINGVTITLTYDAEGRMVSVTGPSITATFVYDGDGKRVKSTINGTATYFVGTHYEVSNDVATKYYYAGAIRVAMKVGAIVYYLLTDHLGSTSLTTSSNGSLVSELRYSAWGGVRYSSGIIPTDYTYTGQYSDSYINLLDYGSRRYDPAIGRFIQPDSIVPLASQGVQAWDRYSYAQNDPIRYIDPDGHRACGYSTSLGGCDETEPKLIKLLDFVENKIFNKNGLLRKQYSDLDAMVAIVQKAAIIYGRDWNSFLSATNYVFIGVYGNGPFTQWDAQGGQPFTGYNFPNTGGFSSHFDDGENQIRHFWGAFATAASTNGQILGPFGYIPNSFIACGGNFLHDVVSDWRGDLDTTVWDYSLSQTAIDMGENVVSGAISSPASLPPLLHDQLSSGSWHFIINNYLLRFIWLTPYN